MEAASIEQLRSEHEAARLALEAGQMRQELALLREIPQIALMDAWGDTVDRREHLYDSPGFGFNTDGRREPISLISDRDGGKDIVFFETEFDLARIRGIGQTLCGYFGGAINIQECLTNYTVGTGYEWKVQEAEGAEAPEGLVATAQRAIDAFLDDNDFQGDLDRELRNRAGEEGEYFLALRPCGWRTECELIEPAQVTQPRDTRDLEDWLAALTDRDVCGSWTFGVHTPDRRYDKPLGYHVVRDSAGCDWDYYPARDTMLARRMGSGVIEHLKRNTKRNVKRGVSDFLAVQQFLEHSEKLLKNTAVGAAVQAAIAFIRQHAQGTTGAAASGLRASGAFQTRTENTPAGSRTRYFQRYEPGSILDIAAGMEYKPGPMGSDRAPNFIAVIQAALRYVGIRFSMPEYMVSGDASNANFSSTLVAESPFVKGREADQQKYGKSFRRMGWHALKIAYEGGYFERFGMPWERIEQLLELVLTPPEVATRDPLKQAQAAQIQIQTGTKSRRTVAVEAGLDYDAELENMRTDGDVPMQVTGQPGQEGGQAPAKTDGKQPEKQAVGSDQTVQVSADAVLNGAQITAATGIVTQVAAGEIDRETGLGQLRVLFNLNADKAEELMGNAGLTAPAKQPTLESAVQRIKQHLSESYP